VNFRDVERIALGRRRKVDGLAFEIVVVGGADIGVTPRNGRMVVQQAPATRDIDFMVWVIVAV
jgi:hypothetical protein